MDLIMSVVVFAVLIETVVELLKPITHKLDFVEERLGFSVAYILSVILGISGAIYFHVNALTLFGIASSGIVGEVLTGLLASAGSNYVHNKLRHVVDIEVGEIEPRHTPGGNDKKSA